MSECLYCIEHEEMELVQHSEAGDCHEYDVTYIDLPYSVQEADWCFFDKGWATCPPPDNFEEDWDLNIEAPSEEELKMMDENAEELLEAI